MSVCVFVYNCVGIYIYLCVFDRKSILVYGFMYVSCMYSHMRVWYVFCVHVKCTCVYYYVCMCMLRLG